MKNQELLDGLETISTNSVFSKSFQRRLEKLKTATESAFQEIEKFQEKLNAGQYEYAFEWSDSSFQATATISFARSICRSLRYLTKDLDFRENVFIENLQEELTRSIACISTSTSQGSNLLKQKSLVVIGKFLTGF